MKKKLIVTSVAFVLVLFVGWMIYSTVTKVKQRSQIENTQTDLSVLLTKLGRPDVAILPQTILVFFNSECDHCRWEIEQISKSRSHFEEYQLLLVSFEPADEARAYLKHHQLADRYLASKPELILDAFSGGVPQTFIYKEGKLRKHFKGEVKVEVVLGELQ